MEILVPEFKILFSAILAGFIVALLIPSIVKIAKNKNLVALPNGRTSHNGEVPTLGGFAIFTSFFIVLLFFLDFTNCNYCKIFMIGAIIMYSVGLKDDIIAIDPWKKLIAQLLAAFLMIFFGGIEITNLGGFLGVYEMPTVISVLFTAFTIIVITNSFNLIDGIDGLASVLGMIAYGSFGIWFYLVNEIELVIICVTLFSSYLIFFLFNTSKGKNKIFMGDGGSLLLGFSISFLAIKFMQLNLIIESEFVIHSAPAVAFGIMIIPLFDTLRVFILRVLRRQSPFKADRTHIHHRILALTGSHKQTTGIISVFNILVISLIVLLHNIGTTALIAFIIFLSLFLFYIPGRIRKKIESQGKVKYNYVAILRTLITMFR